MGWTLPSTGMWRGEVFAISDCLVIIVVHYMYAYMRNTFCLSITVVPADKVYPLTDESGLIRQVVSETGLLYWKLIIWTITKWSYKPFCLWQGWFYKAGTTVMLYAFSSVDKYILFLGHAVQSDIGPHARVTAFLVWRMSIMLYGPYRG